MTFDKDSAGILASSLCILHCLIGSAILVFGITSVQFSILFNEQVHLYLVFPIVLFVIWSIPSGYKVYQKPLPLIMATVGVTLLLMGLIIEEHELVLTFSASLLLILAHFYNKKYLKNTELLYESVSIIST